METSFNDFLDYIEEKFNDKNKKYDKVKVGMVNLELVFTD